jgi:hypothetical protein
LITFWRIDAPPACSGWRNPELEGSILSIHRIMSDVTLENIQDLLDPIGSGLLNKRD